MMYQPTAPIVQFNQAPAQPAPVVQIMQQPSYPPPMPMMAMQAPEPKKDDNRQTYNPNRDSGRGLKIFLIVGIVSAALVACIVVGVVVGMVLTASTGRSRTKCSTIASQLIGALPYRLHNVSRNDCVYGYYMEGVCMYDGYINVSVSEKRCSGDDHGVDHISDGCYYNKESTCHCTNAYREDEDICYKFAINASLVNSCSNGLMTGYYCLYDKRERSKDGVCEKDWDKSTDDFCYTRKRKTCDRLSDGIARNQCLNAASAVREIAA